MFSNNEEKAIFQQQQFDKLNSELYLISNRLQDLLISPDESVKLKAIKLYLRLIKLKASIYGLSEPAKKQVEFREIEDCQLDLLDAYYQLEDDN